MRSAAAVIALAVVGIEGCSPVDATPGRPTAPKVVELAMPGANPQR